MQRRAFSALVYGALLIHLVYPYTDFDWGWHYRYGEYLLTQRLILRYDIFSWTMPGYQWVNHSWLYDPLLYLLYTYTSFFGLSLAGAGTGLLIFFLSVRRARLPYWQTAILAVFFAALSREALMQGLRAQVVGLALLSILVAVLARAREGHLWSYLALPCLFCIWANLHGSFLLGLAVFGVYVVCDFIVLKIRAAIVPDLWLAFAGSFVVSGVGTLVNPFTYAIYTESARHFGNPMLGLVVEWTRPEFPEIVRIVFFVYTFLLAVGFISRWRVEDLPYFVTALMTFYLAVTSRRHVPVFMVVTLPFAATVLGGARLRIEGKVRTSLVFGLLIAACVVSLSERQAEFRDLWRSPARVYCSYGMRCSEGLTEYLIRQPPVGRGFNFYDWGGYLIGIGLKSKVFIDGRMHLWERGEYRPMVDYRAMYVGHDFEAFELHQFDWVIVPSDSDFVKQLTTYRSSRTGLPAMDEWEIPYRDGRALYLIRKKVFNIQTDKRS
jgi:hypothetical protein